MIRLPECPICHKTVAPASDPNAAFAPFCSRRCKEIDLVRWCDGRYAIVEPLNPANLPDSLVDELASQDEGSESGSEYDHD